METVLLDTASGPPFKRLATLQDPADLLGTDRDATRLALLRDGEISLWDVKDRAHPRRLKAEFPLTQDVAAGAGGVTSLLVGPGAPRWWRSARARPGCSSGGSTLTATTRLRPGG
ncbi:hypothetical protein [Streptomyces nojiriensis]|uniref:hypothetical protein n=1 Tax=Streptomyces nojiriensis TaxID=66374 RepID=UPI00364AAD17